MLIRVRGLSVSVYMQNFLTIGRFRFLLKAAWLLGLLLMRTGSASLLVVILNRRKPVTARVTALRLNNNQPPKNFICRAGTRFELPSPRATLQGPPVLYE